MTDRWKMLTFDTRDYAIQRVAKMLCANYVAGSCGKWSELDDEAQQMWLAEAEMIVDVARDGEVDSTCPNCGYLTEPAEGRLIAGSAAWHAECSRRWQVRDTGGAPRPFSSHDTEAEAEAKAKVLRSMGYAVQVAEADKLPSIVANERPTPGRRVYSKAGDPQPRSGMSITPNDLRMRVEGAQPPD